MSTPDDGSASIQSHCVMSTPKISVTTTDNSKHGEQLPSEDVVDLRLETKNSVSNDLSERENHGLCAELLSRNCPHQLQSSTPHVVSNSSGKSYHSNYCINLRSSASKLCLFNESEV